MEKLRSIREWLPFANTVALAVLLVVALGGGSPAQLGGSSTFSGPVNSQAGYQESGTSVINTAHQWVSSINNTATSSKMATTTVEVFTAGGTVFASSTSNTSETFVEEDLRSHSYIELTPNTGNTTYTLMASTSWTNIIPNAGDHRRWLIENATTSAITATIAAGTGIDLQKPDGQNVIIGQNNFAFMDCWRRSDTDIVCVVDETIPAD